VSVGFSPSGVAVSPDGKKVYVANTDSGSVSIIDTATNNITATVNGLNNSFGVAVTPDGTKVYVTNTGNDSVSVIDTATNNITATLDIGSTPGGVAVTPDGTKAYVANSVDIAGKIENSVSVIDTATNTVMDKIDVGFGPFAFGQFIGLIPVRPVLPAANFSSNVSEGYAPLSIQFTDLSENATQWNWNFGDGKLSIEQNPMHIYSKAGRYTVKMKASNSNGTDLKLAEIIVSKRPAPILPVSNFSTNTTSGNAPLSVQFTDLSQNTTSMSWDFGDGANSTEKNPIHVYSAVGTYTANLIVSNSNGTSSKKSTINILQVTSSSSGSSSNGGSSGSSGSSGGSSHSSGGSYSIGDKLSIISNEGNNNTANGSTGKTNATGTATVIQTQNSTESAQTPENSNGTSGADVEQTPKQPQSPNNSGKENTKAPDFEIVCGIVSLVAAVLYKENKKEQIT
jgi:YVTN family beta-propeller protein